MTGVLGKPYLVRQDIVLGVGIDQRIGYRWRQGASPATAVGVDLYGYTGVARMESLHGDPWIELETIQHEDGLVEMHVTPTATGGLEWSSRATGRYSIILTAPDGEVTCLAAGYLTIVNTGAL